MKEKKEKEREREKITSVKLLELSSVQLVGSVG